MHFKSILRPHFIDAVLGISLALNLFFAVRLYGPETWRSIQLMMLRPPVLRPGDHVRGTNETAATVIEYSDFQCPYCAHLHGSLKRLADEGKIRWVIRNYPIASIHRYANQAAEAAECAGEQGRFWDYADLLIESQAGLQNETDDSIGVFWEGLAKKLQLNEDGFRTCVTTHRFAPRVRAEVAEGDSLRIDGTPTFFVNRKRHAGSLSFDELQQMVKTP